MTESYPSSSTPTGDTRLPVAPADTLSVAVRTLGCKVNQVESEGIVATLLGGGALLAEEDRAAVVVINTCTVTGEADKKARKAVRHALGLAQQPVVVVTGCLAAVDAPALRALDPRVVVEADKSLVPARVAEALGVTAHPDAKRVMRAGRGFHTRVMLKVEDGCDNHCTYCIVPRARGVPRAEPLGDLVGQAKELAAAGVGEVVVTGINVGRYRDPATGTDLTGLLEALASAGPRRVRLSSIEPPDLDERLLRAMAALPSFCPHLHVPLQSGSDRVLAAMGRAYTAEEFLARIHDARVTIPGVALTTDVIVGFPGETEADLERTLEVCARAAFSKLHVFRYSRRPETPAAEMPDQVPPETIAARAERVRSLGHELRTSWLETLVGDRVEVLIERIAEDGSAEGTTPQYAKVLVGTESSGCFCVGDSVEVEVLRRQGEVLLCGLTRGNEAHAW